MVRLYVLGRRDGGVCESQDTLVKKCGVGSLNGIKSLRVQRLYFRRS
jgi:hypothetical protein